MKTPIHPSTDTNGVSFAGTSLDETALTTLLEVVGNEPSSVVELIDILLSDSDKYLESIRTGIEQDDTALVRRAAHTLKSSARDFGDTDFYPVAKSVEELARDGHSKDVKNSITEFENRYADFKLKLGQLREILS